MILTYFLFFTLLGVIKMLFPEFDMLQYEQTDLNSLMEDKPWKFAILAVIIAPILEEGMFRTLIRPTPTDFIYFLCCWVLMGVLIFIPIDVNWVIKYLFLILFMAITFLFLREAIPLQFQYKACTLLSRYYVGVWIVTALIFGLVHITNYVDTFQIDLVLFLMIIPRIIAGFYFGKIKVENKTMIWPIAMHAMNNATVLILLLPRIL